VAEKGGEETSWYKKGEEPPPHTTDWEETMNCEGKGRNWFPIREKTTTRAPERKRAESLPCQTLKNTWVPSGNGRGEKG